MSGNWIEVDRAGLAQVIADRPKSFLLFELIQNALDEDVTKVTVSTAHHGHGLQQIVVTDDSPDGYQDIRHAWTLYAPSKKKADPELRGRFNVGCKMVLALATEARVISTKAAVEFTAEGRRTMRKRTGRGTVFEGLFKMSKREAAEALEAAQQIIPPPGVEITLVNEEGSTVLKRSEPIATAEAKLETSRSDDEGVLRRTIRKTRIDIHRSPPAGKPAWLFEMGIPVVPLDGDDPFHIDVQQRVPLNTDRDNVTPAYLRTLRVEVLNATHDLIDETQARTVWATEASEDERAEPDAVEQVLTHRFGEKRVTYDPSDEEANLLAASKGYTVVTGGSLTAGQWANAKAGGSMLPAGQVTPSPSVERRPDGVPPIPEADWDDGMRAIASFARALCSALDVARIERIDWFDDGGLPFSGAWERRSGGRGTLLLNRACLHHASSQFAKGDVNPIAELLIHEFAHQRESNHLAEGYHDELCRLAALCLGLNPGGLK